MGAGPRLRDALEGDAFYASFRLVRPSKKRHLLALDVSGSMTCGEIAGMPGMNPRLASAAMAMAMATARVEDAYHLLGFSHELVAVKRVFAEGASDEDVCAGASALYDVLPRADAQLQPRLAMMLAGL